uniref:Putative 22.6kDa tegument-associated antigen n=1 Tax=Schistosoma mansoni TaxID=6183 RepID=A0A3Q0KP20_SCHMA
MEKFIEIFLKLDSNNNNNGFIKKTELIQYCEKENMDMCMVDEWLKPFNSLDKISFREFCVVFGLKYEEMIMEKKDRENMAVGLSPKPDSDITIFSTSMSLQKQVDITNMFKETLNTKYTDEKSIIVIVNDMKKYLDEKYGKLWQVFIIDGSFWSNFSHEPFLAIEFMYDKFRCVIWRSPAD